jgi:hypothetical protein
MAAEYREALVDADEGWLTANQRVTVEDPSGALVAVGTCRRCHDDTEYPIDLERVVVAEVVGPVVSLDVTRMFRCRCSKPHAKRPANVYTGCGAFWFAQVTGDPDDYKLSPAPLKSIPGAIAVDEAKKAQAGLVQQTAEKWLGAITALLALFSVGGAALTVNSVAALNTAGKLVAAVAAVLAVTSGAVAICYGYRAAYGWLTMAPTATETDAAALADPTRRIGERVTAFQRSTPAAGISLGLAVVALMVIWFAPRANPPAPLIKVTYQQGTGQTAICGTLLDSSSSAVVRIKVQDGPRTTIQTVPPPITRISTVAACSP